MQKLCYSWEVVQREPVNILLEDLTIEEMTLGMCR